MSSVTFPLTGHTYSDDADPNTGLDNYGYTVRLVPMMTDVVTAANDVTAKATQAQNAAASALNAPGTNANSTTSLLIGTGSKVFTIETGKLFNIGQTVVAASKAGPANSMTGVIIAKTDNGTVGTITVSVASGGIGGSGTFADWTISLSALVSNVLPSMTGADNLFLMAFGGAASWQAAMKPGNNLGDLTNVATARANLALGSLAVLNSIDNSNWNGAGTALSILNGGTGSSSAAGARGNIGAAAAGANTDITSLGALSTPLSVAQGGTGANNPSSARAALGCGSMATQSSSSVSITGGSITGINDLAVADGGTGSSTPSGARGNLGAAASGANSDITSLAGLTTALSAGQGGTGFTSLLALLAGLPVTGAAAVEFQIGSLYIKIGTGPSLSAAGAGPVSGNITFTTPFPTACAGVWPISVFSSGTQGAAILAQVDAVTRFGATFWATRLTGSGVHVMSTPWIAVGW